VRAPLSGWQPTGKPITWMSFIPIVDSTCG
jgi:hypothetical protein